MPQLKYNAWSCKDLAHSPCKHSVSFLCGESTVQTCKIRDQNAEISHRLTSTHAGEASKQEQIYRDFKKGKTRRRNKEGRREGKGRERKTRQDKTR